jgi:hypothetical protein
MDSADRVNYLVDACRLHEVVAQARLERHIALRQQEPLEPETSEVGLDRDDLQADLGAREGQLGDGRGPAARLRRSGACGAR